MIFSVLVYLNIFLNIYLLKTHDQIYKTFIQPLLDYCDVIYHTPHLPNPFDSSISLNMLMERVEKNTISSSSCY